MSKTLSSRVAIVKRSNGGNAVRAAAYRSGSLLTCERTGDRFDYREKLGVEDAYILAPDHAGPWVEDRSTLWNAVEARERRKDAQVARDVRVSLPVEIGRSDRRRLATTMMRSEFVAKGQVADVAIHLYSRPWKAGRKATLKQIEAWKTAGYQFLSADISATVALGPSKTPHVMFTANRHGDPAEFFLFQPHLHGLLALRPVTEDGRGFGQKVGVRDAWNARGFEQVRERFAGLTNAMLDRLGHYKGAVDHRTLAQREIEAEKDVLAAHRVRGGIHQGLTELALAAMKARGAEQARGVEPEQTRGPGRGE